jgi:hypothetical protein
VNEIERAAAEHRQKKAREHAERVAKGARDSREKAKARPKVEQDMLAMALGEATYGKWLMGAAVLVGLLGPMVLSLFVLPHGLGDHLVVQLGVVLVCVATIIALRKIVEYLLSGRRMRQLRRIGRGFKLKEYLAQLCAKRRRGTVLARVRFAKPFTGSTRDAIPDAVRTWWPDVAEVKWQSETLVIESKELRGTEHLQGEFSSTTIYNNAEFHGAFLAIVERVLPELGSSSPIASFQVELTGTTAAWDAEP